MRPSLLPAHGRSSPEGHHQTGHEEVCRGQGHDEHVGDGAQPPLHHRAEEHDGVSQECGHVDEGEDEPNERLLEPDPSPRKGGGSRREIRQPRFIPVRQHLPSAKI